MYSEGGSLQECILPRSRGAPGRAGESGREQIRAERAPIPDTAQPRPLLPLSAGKVGRRPLLISMPLMMVPLAQQPPGGWVRAPRGTVNRLGSMSAHPPSDSVVMVIVF